MNRLARPRARGVAVWLLAGAIALLVAGLDRSHSSAVSPCDPPIVNEVVCENSKPGNPESEWDLPVGPDASIEGFTTDISVDQGQQVQFKVKTSSTNYRIDVYRLGYYGGLGGRLVATVQPSVSLPQGQPACLDDAATGLVDCGNWAVSASWNVPGDAVSGIYIGKLVREDPEDGSANHTFFIVRDDDGGSDLLFQTADTTWQAYNSWGGNSLYSGEPDNRAYKVSYNRPFSTRDGPVIGGRQSFLFNAEYPMVRWLEANGYDVSYSTGVDTDRRGAELLEHEVFLSNGHDEYWSAVQRTNVETARTAGVHLAFFSGNEVFWKTRWEPSIDGTSTNYRTLVTYKETKANAKIDPTPVWTGTWRDPRFSPPSDGGQPENALTGQLFMVNGVAYWEMHVPAEDGKMRFWRNTSVATLAPNTVATLPLGTLGYEWDEVPDNGYRPDGLFRLSRTTHDVTPLYLQDFGNTYGAGTATHSLTLYRHSSGALVFGAGTVQWAWGLDDQHEFGGAPADPRMQQATVNLLADMGVQPGSLQAGLVPATVSTDASAPSSQITSPLPGATVVTGTPITIAGTAADSGGQVGGVEVSTDGGVTWRAATGRSSWTYSWTPTALGPATLKSRAVDDTGNLESPFAGVNVTVSHAPCPCSLWDNSATPAQPSQNDPQQVEVGVKFQSVVSGYITGIEFYKGPANTGTHTANLWTNTGTLLASAVFTNETAGGWQGVTFAAPVAIMANTTYVASYHTTSGGYALTAEAFASSGVTNLPLKALSNAEGAGNGLYKYGASGFPTQTFASSNYWVDPVFHDQPVDPVAPSLGARSPAPGATQVTSTAPVTATFTEPVDPQSISFVLKRPDNSVVPANVTYDSGTWTATLQPSAPLEFGTTYTATMSGAADGAGNVMTTTNWSFTTVTCPCSIWSNSVVPTGTSQSDGQPLELGVKFRPQMDGYVTGIRFHKGATNTGTHIGSLWTAAGALLSSATFSNETASGWQEVTFPAPVAVTANTTYVASYHNPTGNYVTHQGFFATAGVTAPPLVALQNGVDGGNGVFRVGATGFPDQTFNSSNYWVDVAFSAVFVDPVAPVVTARVPAAGATKVAADTSVSATFSEPVTPASISFVLRRPDNSVVPAVVSYDAGSRTALLVPSEQLAYGTAYSAELSGAADPAGNVMSPSAWSFTTVTCPCSIWDDTTVPTGISQSDGQPLELGVKFRPAVDGFVTGIRFHKGANNTGTHVGNLWSEGGILLASAMFQGETGSGWQEVMFATPVPVTANTLYVASYHNPTGNYLVSRDHFTSGLTSWPLIVPSDGASGGNGVFKLGASGFPAASFQASNYWVDLAFSITPPAGGDTTPPVLSAIQAGNLGMHEATITWATDEPATTRVDYGTTAAYGSFAPLVPSNSLVTNHSQQLTGLLPNTLYHYRVVSRDVAGNEAASSDFTFTTLPPSCPCSIWSPASTPATPSAPDSGAFELGVKFRADIDGSITGIRFYKGATNTGAHTGSLWSSGGQLLATATFTDETATGWQQVTFAAPVAVTAGVTYIASYHTDTGGYARDQFYFSAGPAVTSPLRALQDGVDGGNGVFAIGASAFPTQSFSATNYWVDVVFMHNSGDTAAPVITEVAAGGITFNGATIGWTTDEPATTQVEYGSTIAYGSLAPAAPSGATSTAHTQALNGLSASTLYHYRVLSRDAAGNLATSEDFTFTTAPPPDSNAPVISAVTAGSITSSAATIQWATDEASTTQVEYGPTGAYGSLAPPTPNLTLVTAHSQALSGLTGGTTYHYRVRSRDAAGNEAVSSDFTFTTPGMALRFDGGNDRATVSDSASLDLTGPLTLEAWVKFDDVTLNWWQTLIFKRGTSSNLAYALYYHDGIWFEIRSGTTNVWVRNQQRLQAGVWYHIAGVYDRTNLRIFVNGELKGTTPFTGPVITSSYPLQLGFNNVWTFEQFHGTLDEVRISRSARYSAPFTPPSAPFAPDADTVALWHLDEGTGQTSADASGNNNTLRRGTSTSSESSDPAWVAGASFGGSVALLGSGGPGGTIKSQTGLATQAVLPAAGPSRREARPSLQGLRPPWTV